MCRRLLSLVLSICLSASAFAQTDGKQAGKKGKNQTVMGVIQKVEKSSDSQGVFITVEVMHKKKDESSESAKEEKRFQITPSAKVEKLSGAKDNRTQSDLKLEDLKPGQHVMISTAQGKVQSVSVRLERKKK